MTEYKTVLEMIDEAGKLPPKPKGTEYAIKFVKPDWTTHGGFQYNPAGRWTEPVERFDPVTCRKGGLHVADSFSAAQSGGAKPSCCLVVAYRPSESGEWKHGKLKVRRLKVLAPVDLVGIIRTNGYGANLYGAYLYGASLNRANLNGANLTRASLNGANLNMADLYGTNLSGAKWSDATIWPGGFTPPKATT